MNGRTLRIRAKAQTDLRRIVTYIARDSPQNAEKVGRELVAEIRGPLDMPGKGHTRDELNDDRFRFWSVYSYLLVYRFDDKRVDVLRVIHGAQDLQRVFREN
jgi:toxin ParE1/3/4